MQDVTFGPFQLDLKTGELRRAGAAVKLQPQPARLLALLVSRAGQLVTREEIRRQLWDAETFVDFDQSVNFSIRQIRATLNDDADRPCYVETVPRRGYRFIAPVRSITEANGALMPVPDAGRAPVIGRLRPRGRRASVAIGALAAVVALIAAVLYRTEGRPRAATVRPIDPAAREQVVLGRFFLAKSNPADTVKAIELFEAAIARDKKYAEAYAGLARAYNRLGSVFIAGRSPADARMRAVAAATRAIQLDSGLADAYAALGDTMLHELEWVQAEKALTEALRLNPDHAEAHTSYASYLIARGRGAEAIHEARRGLDLAPASVGARHTLAWMLYFNHEYDAARGELEKTLQMEAGFTLARWRLGQVEIVAGRFADAVRELERAGQDAGRTPAVLGLLAMAYAGLGRHAAARHLADELQVRGSTEVVPPSAIALAYIGAGDPSHAIASLQAAYDSHDNYVIYMCADPLLDSLRADARFQALCQRLD